MVGYSKGELLFYVVVLKLHPSKDLPGGFALFAGVCFEKTG